MPYAPHVLLIADLNFYAKGHFRLQALNRLGVAVDALSHTKINRNPDGAPNPSLAFRIAWKLGVHIDTEKINRKIIDKAQELRPDLIWIEKGNMIYPGTLTALHKLLPRSIIASYSEDDMFNPINRSFAYKWGLKHYNIVFVPKSFNANSDELPSLGARVCQFVDKAFDPEQHRPLSITNAEREAYGADVGFIGTYAPERGRDVLFLAENGLSVRVWGNGWHAFNSRHQNLKIEGRALVNRPGDFRYTKSIVATKINLGFLRKINRDLQTDRSVEIPACGSFMLAEHSTEHERLFKDGKEAVFYKTPRDLIEKAKYYLKNRDARQAIGEAGRKRCLESDYSHDNRMAFMLNLAIQKQS